MATKSLLECRRVNLHFPAQSGPKLLVCPNFLLQYLLVWSIFNISVVAAEAQEANPDTLIKNPFRFETLGLPVQFQGLNACDVGEPELLDEQTVRTIAEQIFLDENMALKKRYVWMDGTRALTLDGFDSTTRIGYVILPTTRFGTGTVMGIREMHLNNKKSWLETKVKNIKDINNPDTIDRVLKSTFLGEKDIYIPEISDLIDKIVATKSKSIRKKGIEKIELLHHYNLLFPASSLVKRGYPGIDARDPVMKCFLLIEKEAFKLTDLKQNSETKHYWELLVQIFNLLQVQYDYKAQEQITTALSGPTDWVVIQSVITTLNQSQASLEEIRYLTELAYAGKLLVAVIPLNGSHTVIRNNNLDWNTIPPEPNSRPGWGKLDEKTKWEQLHAYDKALNEAELQANKKALEASKRRLESEIRQFIQWSKAQGKY